MPAATPSSSISSSSQMVNDNTTLTSQVKTSHTSSTIDDNVMSSGKSTSTMVATTSSTTVSTATSSYGIDDVPAVLGFLEPIDDDVDINNNVEAQDLPSLFGGSPLWLRGCPPTIKDTSCSRCGAPLTFLLQFYAPESHPNTAFHRYLYVLLCTSGACYPSPSDGSSPNTIPGHRIPITILRSQLPEHDPHYLPLGPNTILHRQPLSEWNSSINSSTSSETPKKRIVLPAYDLVTDDEDLIAVRKALATATKTTEQNDNTHKNTSNDDNDDDDDEDEFDEVAEANKISDTDVEFVEFITMRTKDNNNKSEMEDITALKLKFVRNQQHDAACREAEQAAVAAGLPLHEARKLTATMLKNGDTAVEDSETTVDQEFLHFQHVVSVEPEQVVRYDRSPVGGTPVQPLWCSGRGEPKPNDIPACPYCGAQRSFEMQVMPQVLSHMGTLVDCTSANAVDFGIICIYTCNENCQPNNVDYMYEFAWIQNFSSHSISDGWR